MQDIFTAERRAWLAGDRRSAPNDKARMQAKFDAARAAMGDKYCCHPSRRVQHVGLLPTATPERLMLNASPALRGALSIVQEAVLAEHGGGALWAVPRLRLTSFSEEDLEAVRLFFRDAEGA